MCRRGRVLTALSVIHSPSLDLLRSGRLADRSKPQLAVVITARTGTGAALAR
jgi:hypothetical protein